MLTLLAIVFVPIAKRQVQMNADLSYFLADSGTQLGRGILDLE